MVVTPVGTLDILCLPAGRFRTGETICKDLSPLGNRLQRQAKQNDDIAGGGKQHLTARSINLI